jgi:hypothetical protein
MAGPFSELMAETTTKEASFGGGGGAAFVDATASESNDALAAGMKEDLRQISAAQARFIVRLAESNRRMVFRDEGATSPEAWVAERFGISVPTARSLSLVADKAPELPDLVGSLSAGDISFDKVRAVVDVATRETDRELSSEAKGRSVRELVEVARDAAARARSASASPSRSEHDSRYLRFNDALRTMSLQVPKEEYARTKACVDAWAGALRTDKKAPLDQRRCEGFMGMVDSATPGNGSGTGGAGGRASDPATAPNPYLVVAHVPLEALVEESGETSELAGELEHHGLIDVETVQRIACDATMVVAVDDEAGHTMYEGRARRFPSGAQRREIIRRDRHCRFPGCANATFVVVHHIVAWKPGGPTDLDNLVLLCKGHHGVVHRNGWSLSGDANQELSVTTPTGRVMVSRPSPLWTRVTAARRSAGSG